jgi:cytoskeletal protein RodZ
MENTENTPENIEETQDNDNVRQLGQLLQNYREKAGMDIDQAADALCLTTGTLEALENEDFHLLPEAPYIRGYLRGYAKLADVSSAEAIALYESLRGGSTVSDYKFTPSKPEDYTSSPGLLSSSIMKFGGAFVILLLLVILSTIPGVKSWATDIWAEFSKETVVEDTANNENDETVKDTEKVSNKDEQKEDEDSVENTAVKDETPADSEAEEKENTLADADQVTEESISQTSSVDESEETQEAATLEGVIERQADTPETTASASDDEKAEVDSNEAESPTEQATDASDAETTLAQNETDVEQNEASESDAQTNENSSDENVETTATTTTVDMSEVNTEAGEVAIKLVFDDEVWMRIKKGDGKQVFEGLRKSGEVHELKSVKPLNFKVGNALGVKIYINGQLYDQKPHQRGVVSRFDIE